MKTHQKLPLKLAAKQKWCVRKTKREEVEGGGGGWSCCWKCFEVQQLCDEDNRKSLMRDEKRNCGGENATMLEQGEWRESGG